MGIDFNKLIDNFLLREYKPKSIGRYYPSEIGGCIRKTWFSYKNPKKVKAELMRIFEAGNMLHEFVSEVIRSEKNPEVELIKDELPVKIEGKDFTISGRVDNIVLVKVNGEQVLIEVKSVKFFPVKPQKQHITQLQLYMLATNIHKGIILYIEKDNLQTKWFDVDYDEKKAESIIEKFSILDKSLKEDKMPMAEAKQNQEIIWMCRYCDWKEECDKAGIGAQA